MTTPRSISEADARAVLAKHPLKAGEGHATGHVVCEGCRWVLGDPVGHIVSALFPALSSTESDFQPPEDPRESQTVWGHTGGQE